VPENLKVRGGKELFTVTVTYNTLVLYGKVEASKKVLIEGI